MPTKSKNASPPKTYDSLAGRPGSAELARELAAIITREHRHPVRAVDAVYIALEDSIRSRKP